MEVQLTLSSSHVEVGTAFQQSLEALAQVSQLHLPILQHTLDPQNVLFRLLGAGGNLPRVIQDLANAFAFTDPCYPPDLFCQAFHFFLALLETFLVGVAFEQRLHSSLCTNLVFE